MVEVSWLNAPPRELTPRAASSVELLTSGPPNDRSYVEVAFISITPAELNDISGLLELLRERAGRIGCDAVVVKAVREENVPVSGTCLLYRRGS